MYGSSILQTMRTFLFDLPVLPDAVLDCREGLTRARKALVFPALQQGTEGLGTPMLSTGLLYFTPKLESRRREVEK